MHEFYSSERMRDILKDIPESLSSGIPMIVVDTVGHGAFSLVPAVDQLKPATANVGLHLIMDPDEEDSLWDGITLSDDGEVDDYLWQFVPQLTRNIKSTLQTGGAGVGTEVRFTGYLPCGVQLAAVWAGLSMGCIVAISKGKRDRVYSMEETASSEVAV